MFGGTTLARGGSGRTAYQGFSINVSNPRTMSTEKNEFIFY